MANRHFARTRPCLAPDCSTTRNRIRRRIPNYLDGSRILAAARHRPTAGLLFDEHVERICALGRDNLGANAFPLAVPRRGDRPRP